MGINQSAVGVPYAPRCLHTPRTKRKLVRCVACAAPTSHSPPTHSRLCVSSRVMGGPTEVKAPPGERRVFVLGDSISIHYGPHLKIALAERGWGYHRKSGVDEALADLDNGDLGERQPSAASRLTFGHYSTLTVNRMHINTDSLLTSSSCAQRQPGCTCSTASHVS